MNPEPNVKSALNMQHSAENDPDVSVTGQHRSDPPQTQTLHTAVPPETGSTELMEEFPFELQTYDPEQDQHELPFYQPEFFADDPDFFTDPEDAEELEQHNNLFAAPGTTPVETVLLPHEPEETPSIPEADLFSFAEQPESGVSESSPLIPDEEIPEDSLGIEPEESYFAKNRTPDWEEPLPRELEVENLEEVLVFQPEIRDMMDRGNFVSGEPVRELPELHDICDRLNEAAGELFRIGKLIDKFEQEYRT